MLTSFFFKTKAEGPSAADLAKATSKKKTFATCLDLCMFFFFWNEASEVCGGARTVVDRDICLDRRGFLNLGVKKQNLSAKQEQSRT